jgi:Domain of unknown function (DUF1844)
MAEKKHESSGFTVTDRRLFTSDGDLRTESTERKELTEVAKPEPAAATATSPAAAEKPVADVADDSVMQDMPIPPTAAEQEAQAAAYRQSSKDVDSQVELSGRSSKEFEVSFERFLASLYMTAMMQMGMMHEQGGQPRIDIVGARQTIDTLSMISEKTKGNLTSVEENFLQNSLYELRMAYVEVTNALARPPKGQATGTVGR